MVAGWKPWLRLGARVDGCWLSWVMGESSLVDKICFVSKFSFAVG